MKDRQGNGPFRAIVFDLDGTLIHSAPDLHRAANAMLAELGREGLSLERLTSFVGHGVAKLVERCLDATGGGTAEERRTALALYLRHYDAAPAALTRPFPGVEEALAALAATGVRLGICTNKPEALTIKVLDDLGIRRHFHAVVGGDTLPVLKPDPAPLHLCLERLGAEVGAALYVGDSETDALTATNAGIAFALFSGGYRKSPVESFEAAVVFAHFEELTAFAGAGRQPVS